MDRVSKSTCLEVLPTSNLHLNVLRILAFFNLYILIIAIFKNYVKRYFRLLLPVLKYRVSEVRGILYETKWLDFYDNFLDNYFRLSYFLF